MMRVTKIAAPLLLSGLLSGCDSDLRWKSGKYQVDWSESRSSLFLSYDVGGGEVRLVQPHVFAIGEDARWIVAARRPDDDKSKTEFFYFSKTDGAHNKNANEMANGPFSDAEFKQKSASLGLPVLSKYF